MARIILNDFPRRTLRSVSYTHLGDDDIEQQVEQKFRRDTVGREQQPARDQKGEHAVDGGGDVYKRQV